MQLKAFSLIKKEFPSARLWVIGDGYMRDKLFDHDLNGVKFYGHVENHVKYDLIQKAHLVPVPGY